MLRKMIAGTSAAAFCLTGATPLLAQDYHRSAFDAPPGATATLNFRMPLGGGSQRARPAGPTLGLTLGYGQRIGASSLDARPVVRQIRLADFRFGRSGLRRAELATFDLANLDKDQRLSFLGDSDGGDDDTLKLIIVGVLAAGAGVLVEEWLDKSSEESPEDPETPQSPGLG